MNRESVYLKIEQNVQVFNKKVYLQDFAKLYSVDKNLVSNLNHIVVLTINENKDVKRMISVLKIIELIHKESPGVQVVNLGEIDFVLEYKIPKQSNQIKEYFKTAFVSLVVFCGAAFSIMTFNTDVYVQDVLTNFYQLIMGDSGDDIAVLEIAYSVGLPVGIIVFFNHFSKLKIHDDPTPLQIEMRNYEEEVNKALIEDASRENKTIDAN